jgi:hypothetical protein
MLTEGVLKILSEVRNKVQYKFPKLTLTFKWEWENVILVARLRDESTDRTIEARFDLELLDLAISDVAHHISEELMVAFR